MSASRREALLNVGLLVVTLVFGFAVLPLGIGLGFGSDGAGLSPRFLPQLATVGIALALAVGVLQCVVGAPSPAEAQVPQQPHDRHPLRVLSAVTICMLFASFGFSLAGFYIGGAVMVASLTVLLGVRKAGTIFLFSVLIAAAIYLIFEMGLQIRLPKSNWLSGVPV
jgi:hypothetical protein